MRNLSTTLKVLTCAIFIMALSSLAQAATRTWVSGVGDDMNPCSRTAPCKTYAGAISKTDKDGEISTLDPGGFGAVTITKSLTINGGNGGQGYGSILASFTTGVIVNITDAADVRKTVRLDWLNINGASTGTDGIRFIAGTALHVENLVIDGFTGEGIDVNKTSAGTVTVTNTTIRNCGSHGISTVTTGGSIKISLENVRVMRCLNGLRFSTGTLATVSNTVSTLNTTAAMKVEEPGALDVIVSVERSVFSLSAVGISAGTGTANVILSNSFVASNTGVAFEYVGAGVVNTGTNNRVVGNGTNNSPNGAAAPPA